MPDSPFTLIIQGGYGYKDETVLHGKVVVHLKILRRKTKNKWAVFIQRRGEVVSRWAHNPKVGSSSLSVATKWKYVKKIGLRVVGPL